jgi:hypothetical protein
MHCGSLICVLALLPAIAPAQGIDWIRGNYAKTEVRIPMRDGVKLFTAIYAPKDHSRSYPILLTRTPYSVFPYGEEKFPPRLGPSVGLAHAGYIFVEQDVRGRYLSEGAFVEMRPQLEAHPNPQAIDESTDTYDTIEWLVHNVAGNNGRVGMTGTSYPGFYAAVGSLAAHPALKAVSPQAPMVDLFLGDDYAHNGAFYLAANFGFYFFFQPQKEPELPKFPVRFDYGTPDGYAFYLGMGPVAKGDEKFYKHGNVYYTEMLAHTSYDEYWKARSLTPHLHDIQPAVMVVGGWYDTEDPQGVLRYYASASTRNPRAPVSIVMGPWSHGGWHGGDGERLGPIGFGQKTAEFFREQIEAPFFERWLRDGADPGLPAAWMFNTGANQWRQFPAWPPANTQPRTLYLREQGALSFDAPPAGGGFDQYVSDPAHPVPYTAAISVDMSREYPTEDQRFAATRPDVLVYQTAPLAKPLTVAGPLRVRLHVSTSGTDSDWVVKLIDVYPGNASDPNPNPARIRMGGYQQLVRGEPFRGRFWKSFEEPRPLPANEFVEIGYDMPDVLHTFLAGHRIMVQVQSSWFPLVDRNPQTFVESIPYARPEDFRAATQRVAHSAGMPSRIEIQVME